MGVVTILLAAAGVDSGGEQVTVGIGTEPRVGVGGRQGYGVEPVYLVAIADPDAVGAKVGPTPAVALAGDAGLPVIDEVELYLFCHSIRPRSRPSP